MNWLNYLPWILIVFGVIFLAVAVAQYVRHTRFDKDKELTEADRVISDFDPDRSPKMMYLIRAVGAFVAGGFCIALAIIFLLNR